MRQWSLACGAFFLAAYAPLSPPSPEALTVTALGVLFAGFAVYWHFRTSSEPNWALFREMLVRGWKSHGL